MCCPLKTVFISNAARAGELLGEGHEAEPRAWVCSFAPVFLFREVDYVHGGRRHNELSLLLVEPLLLS